MGRKILKEIKGFLKSWGEARSSTFGASVAYYTIFSIAPLLVIAIAIAGIFVDQQQVQGGIIRQFEGTFGQSGATFIQTLVDAQVSTDTNMLLAVIGFVILLIGATGVFGALQSALDAIFTSLPPKVSEGWWSTVLRKLLSFGMVLSIGFLLLASLVLSAFLAAASEYVTRYISLSPFLIGVAEFFITFILISFFFGLLYKLLPTRRLSWKPAFVGGIIACMLFMVSKYLLGFYLAHSASFAAYGAASSLVLIIIWIYYMSQVFFFGAHIVKRYVIGKSK